MKQFFAFVRKEFYHIFRDKQTMLILLLMPVVQVILFGFAITTDIQNTSIGILDSSGDIHSRTIINNLESSNYFKTDQYLQSPQEVEAAFRKGKIKLILIFPENFGKKLEKGEEVPLQLLIDGSNPNEANIIYSYVQQVVGTYQQNLIRQYQIPASISIKNQMLYNPQLKSSYTFVPGVIGLILLLICTLMTSVSIVREKEFGTMEVLLVSPSKPLYIIFSKSLPYFVISLFNLIAILLLSYFMLDVPIRGSITLLMAVCITYILTSLALGMLISTVSKTQQIAMILSLIGLMLPTLLLSGLLFPLDSMPSILQWISNIIPATWFIDMVKGIMIKGVGIAYIWKQWLILGGMTAVLVIVNLICFKVRL